MSIPAAAVRIGGEEPAPGRQREEDMRKITAVVSLSLDGVMQAPGRPDEDRRGGFAHGGWAVPYNDHVMMESMGKGMAAGGPLLFGRRTYEDFFGVWHGRTDNPFSAVLDNSEKHVVSRSLREPLPWANSSLVPGEAPQGVAELKRRPGPDLTLLGSGELLRTLSRHGLVDTYVLLIHPLLLGGGQRLFAEDAPRAALVLVDSVKTTKGVVIATYRRDDGQPGEGR
jgi:dihydrofolate reductase